MRRMLLATTVLLLPTTLATAEKGKSVPSSEGNAGFMIIEADGHGLHGAPWAPQEQIQSLSSEFGIDAIPAPMFVLPAQDNDFYIAQDEVEGHGNGPKPFRFAVPLAANISVEHGEWLTVPGGSLWRLEIASENAFVANLALRGISLPDGQHIRISAPGQVDSTVGPIEDDGQFDNGTAWGLCLPGARTMIEWFVPTGQRVKNLPFAEVDYFHGYRDSDKRMYGVLTCGASSCANTAADDGYGRWDVAVNSGGFAALLAAGSDDAQEPNDSCAAARATTAGTSYANMVVKRLDEDWYSIPLPVGSSMSMNMTFTHANGDVDVELYGACGGAVVLSRVANTNNEVFTYTNATASSTILMRVFLGADTRNNYTFSYTVTTPPPANDDCVSATPVIPGSYAFDTTGATNSAPTIAASCIDGAGATLNKDVWFRFVPECNGTATISTCGTAAFDTRIVVYSGALTCPTTATPVFACNDDTAGCGSLTSSVTFEATDVGQYYVRIGSKANVGGSGTVSFTCTPSAPPCPADIDGNGSIDGGDLAALLGSWGACP